MSWKFILAFSCFLLLMGCEEIAVLSTPKKQAVNSQQMLAKKAEAQFWETLHSGNYDGIDHANRLLMAAYLQNPNDAKLAAHLGFLHIWKITECYRHTEIPPTIVNEAILAKKYFHDAVELNPDDARFLGFYGDSQLAVGSIFHDEREKVRGYFTIKRAIWQWPEFNYFTGGYILSTLPANTAQFKEGLAWQWATLDLCAGKKINHANPDFSPYLSRETQEGPQRACWNSWIAPFNFEGFFLNMGDMLVKAGDWQTAIKIYQNAKLDRHYAAWPYRNLLEQRIVNARENVKNFQKNYSGKNKTILFNAGAGCVVCHEGGQR